MQQWYYLTDRQERLAVSEDQMSGLAATGLLRASSLVWKRGMKDWVPCGEVKPEIFTAATRSLAQSSVPGLSVEAETALVARLALPLARYRIWFRLLGVLFILSSFWNFVATGVLVWNLISGRQLDSLTGPLAAAGEGNPQLMWFIAVIIFIVGGIYFWVGLELILSAARARRAAAGGHAESLAGAQAALGRSAMIGVIATMLLITATTSYMAWRVYQNSRAGAVVPPKSVSL